jgi:hypothetical protein
MIKILKQLAKIKNVGGFVAKNYTFSHLMSSLKNFSGTKTG